VEILSSGAEAFIYLDEISGEKVIRKVRVKKRYRIEELDDRLRRARTRREVKLMVAARRAGVRVPFVLDVKDYEIIMEYIPGERLDDHLRRSPEKTERLAEELGILVGRLHLAGIAHNDLTVANVIIHEEELCILDFGLGEFSSSVEERAVDLLVLERSIRSSIDDPDLFLEAFVRGYKAVMGDEAEHVLKRIDQVRKRGRYHG